MFRNTRIFIFSISIVLLSSTWVLAAPRIAVIGAGLSGLTTAYRLKKAGYDVSVYEARNRPGGRVFTVNIDGAPIELGGQNLNDGGDAKNITQLVQEMGLKVDTLPSQAKAFFYDPKKEEIIQVHSDPKTQVEPVTADTVRYLSELEKVSSDFSDVLDRFFDEKPLLRRIFESRMKSYEGSETPFLDASYATTTFLWMLRRSESLDRDFRAGKTSTYEMKTIHGGNALLVNALANQLKKDIHYKMVLSEIKKASKSGFDLIFEGKKKAQTDILVLTLPGSVLRFIKIDDGIVPGKQWDSILSLQYGKVAKILLPVQPKEENQGFVFSDHFFTWFNQPERKVLTFWYTGADANMNDSSPTFSEQLERDLKPVRQAFPSMGVPSKRVVQKPQDAQFSSYSGPVGVSWPNERFTLGGYTNISIQHAKKFKHRVSAYGETVIDMFKPVDGKVFFAGEHTALDNPATLEGAVESGERTARMMIQRLKQPITPRNPNGE